MDAHFWGEHDDAENETIYCKFCDEIFVSLHDLMKHKKTNHREKVSLCDNFSNGSCIYGDENCWFVHENETEEIDLRIRGKLKEQKTKQFLDEENKLKNIKSTKGTFMAVFNLKKRKTVKSSSCNNES